MPIPIPIPIGAKRVAAVAGSVWKIVHCAGCQQDFAYLLHLEAIGEDHDLLFLDAEGSRARAQANAQRNLEKQCDHVALPVPCPHCGFYQDDMVSLLKEEGASSSLFTVGLVVTALSFVPLLFDVPQIWIVTAAGVSLGVALMLYVEVTASRLDPNAGDPEPRKLLGRRHAVWGEQLDELLANLKSRESPIR